LDLAAESGDGHRHRHGAEQVEPVALEQLVRAHRDEDVEVAPRPPASARVAFTGQPDARAVVDAGRNADLQPPLAPHLAHSAAVFAGIQHELPGAAATGAGALDGEEALRRPHTSLPTAAAAGRGTGAGARARAGTGLAGHRRGDDDLHLGAGVGLLEADLEIVAQVLAAGRAARSARAAAEHVAEDVAEHLVEDVVHVVHAGRAGAARAAVDTGVAEPVVGRTLLGIGEDRIGFVDFLEPRGGLFAPAVAVRVVLHRQLAEGGLQGRLVAAAGYAQDLVIVTHRSSALGRLKLSWDRARSGARRRLRGEGLRHRS